MKNKDIVVNDIKPEEKNDNLYKSLQKELNQPKVETEDDINKKPYKRRARKTNRPMTDIVWEQKVF